MHAGSATGSQEPEVSKIFAGRYRMLEKLARGGMGEVFAVLDTSTNKRVALKRMLVNGPDTKNAELHFMREYHALTELKHPRIIEVYDYGVEDGSPYYTMELLDGKDLRDLAPLPFAEACRYLHDVASSLALLHARRLLHRDLSPRNVRCTSDGRAKLLDFGTMIPFGAPHDVAGTPPCVPLEALQGAPLDQRADLYALGALGYWLLTGTHARDVRTFEELPDAWKKPLIRPKRRVGDIPDTLDEMIVSLLQLNPDKRPSSAAVVIDALSAIGSLPPEDTSDLAQSFLGSTQLVGRDEVVGEIGKRLDETLAMRGCTLLIGGAAGTGKSRLLHEAALLAQTRGLLVVRAHARNQRGSRALARDLLLALRKAAPDEVTRAFGDAPEVSAWVDRDNDLRPTLVRADMNNELRGRVQAALDRGFCEVAKLRPLLFAIDDLDRADELSISLLASLGRQARSLPFSIVATHSQARTVGEQHALTPFDAIASSVPLSDLSREHSDTLVRSLFGDAPNPSRVMDWLFRAAHGNPGMTLALAQHLFARGAVRYAAGTWVLPSEEITEVIPNGLSHVLTLRIDRLQPHARALAELLCLRGGNTSVALCVSAAEGDSASTFAALEELVRESILESAADGYAFVQEAMRDTIIASILPARKKLLHARLARALLQDSGRNIGSRLEAGSHLVQTDDELAGADLLSALGSDLITSGLDTATAVPAIEKALDVYERHQRPLAQRLRLRSTLMRAAWIFDYQLARRYGDETLAMLYELSGLQLADRWSPKLGRLPALMLAITVTEIKRWFRPASRRGPFTVRSLTYFARTVSSLMGIHATALDGPSAQRLWGHLDAFGALPKLLGARGAYSSCRALALQPLGVEARLHLALQAALADLKGFRGLMRESERQDLLVGLHLADGINECYKLSSQALARADVLEQLGTQLAKAAAHRVRMVYYVVRSDRENTEHYQRLIDLHGIQGGTTWQVEWFSVPVEGMVGAFMADSLLTQRALVRLERLVKDVPSLVPMRDMVRIGYHYRRGDYEKAVFLGEAFLERAPPRSEIGWAPAYATIAICMMELGQLDRARALIDQALAVITEADREYYVMYAPIDVAHAAVLFMLGERERAAVMFGELVTRLGDAGEHAAVVLVHESHARVCRMSGDRMGYLAALDALRRTAVLSRKPSVVMFADRVAASRTRFTHGTVPPVDPNAKPEAAERPKEATAITSFLASCTTPDDRRYQALRILAEASDGREGYLYVLSGKQPLLVASLQDRKPSTQLSDRIASIVERRGERASIMLHINDSADDGPHTLFLLTDESDDGQKTAVGIAVVKTTTGAPKHVQGSLLRDVARMLRDTRETDSSALATIRVVR